MNATVALGVFAVCATIASTSNARGQENVPVVLVPGFLGSKQSGVMLSYFPTIKDALLREGADVTEIAPPPLADSDVRGASIAHQIDALCTQKHVDKVIVIAHSQGGVDVRAALAHGAAEHIAAVATISSPHHGTGVADTALTWPAFAVDGTLGALSVLWQIAEGDALTAPDANGALAMLSTPGMTSFESTHAARDAVPFFSIASVTGRRATNGSCDGGLWSAPRVSDPMNPLLVFGAAMIRNALGDVDNDGVVPTASMRYGIFLGCAPADHVDWEGLDRFRGPFDEAAFTVELWRGLEDVVATNDAHAMNAHVPRLARFAFARPLVF